MANRIALYGGPFQNQYNPAANQQQVEALRNSGINTMILWALHVNPCGDLFYNGPPFEVHNGLASPQLLEVAPYLTGLRAGGVETILFSIGGWGVGDFRNMESLLLSASGRKTLLQNFYGLAEALGVDGFDFDMEEEIAAETIVQLTELLQPAGRQGILTYCPYGQPNGNALMEALSMVFERNRVQLVDWFNLQCYSGGAGQPVEPWIAAVGAEGTGVASLDASRFIVPGYSFNPTDDEISQATPVTPEQFETFFAGLDATVEGGFVWNASLLLDSGFPAADYGASIANGLAALQEKPQQAEGETA
jgi:hypothetical protein